MQVILRADVEKVGLRGDVVDVAAGFARNFLLPRKLADTATPGRLADLRRREDERARHEARTFEQGQQIAGVLEQTVLRFEVKAGPTGALFGSVTATDIADELWRGRKVRVDRRKIDLPEPIKRVGRYEIPIEVFTDVAVAVQTHVVPEGGELPPEDEEQVPAEVAAGAEASEPSGEAVPQVPEDAFDRSVDAGVPGEQP